MPKEVCLLRARNRRLTVSFFCRHLCKIQIITTDILLADVIGFSKLTTEDQFATIHALTTEIKKLLKIMLGQAFRDEKEVRRSFLDVIKYSKAEIFCATDKHGIQHQAHFIEASRVVAINPPWPENLHERLMQLHNIYNKI